MYSVWLIPLLQTHVTGGKKKQNKKTTKQPNRQKKKNLVRKEISQRKLPCPVPKGQTCTILKSCILISKELLRASLEIIKTLSSKIHYILL